MVSTGTVTAAEPSLIDSHQPSPSAYIDCVQLNSVTAAAASINSARGIMSAAR